jgi:hypothetical protein
MPELDISKARAATYELGKLVLDTVTARFGGAKEMSVMMLGAAFVLAMRALDLDALSMRAMFSRIVEHIDAEEMRRAAERDAASKGPVN